MLEDQVSQVNEAIVAKPSKRAKDVVNMSVDVVTAIRTWTHVPHDLADGSRQDGMGWERRPTTQVIAPHQGHVVGEAGKCAEYFRVPPGRAEHLIVVDQHDYSAVRRRVTGLRHGAH